MRGMYMLLTLIVILFLFFTIASLFTSPFASIKLFSQNGAGKKKPFELFTNPILSDGADPWVIKHTDDFYYYTHTTGNNITIWKSETLTGLATAPHKVVWTPEPGAPNGHHIWAPELHFIDGHWYIYFAASAGDMEKQRMYVLQSEGADPWGPYKYPEGTQDGKLEETHDKWAIDATVLEYQKQLYLIWSGWEGDVNVSQHLYIAPMDNPWTLSGPRVEISRPELPWEKIGNPLINEGPQVLKNKQGVVFLLYSGSGSWTDDYKLGMLTLIGDDPLDPASWEKKQTPVFEKNLATRVYAPGHSSFVTSPDGKEDWIVYHAAKYRGGGWSRNVRMQPFTWNEDGTPNFGTPVGTGAYLRKPSGETEGEYVPALPGVVYKYEGEDALVHEAKVVHHPSASGGKKVGHIDYNDSLVEFEVGVPAGAYTLVAYYSNGSGQQASHFVHVNEDAIGELKYESDGWDVWRKAEIDVNVDVGMNAIRFSKGLHFAEIDYIELIPKETVIFKYEAEFAQLYEVEAVYDANHSNGQYVLWTDGNAGSLEWVLDVPEAGTYEMITRFQPIGGNEWASRSETMRLKSGKNKIKLKNDAEMKAVDYMTLEYKEK